MNRAAWNMANEETHSDPARDLLSDFEDGCGLAWREGRVLLYDQAASRRAQIKGIIAKAGFGGVVEVTDSLVQAVWWKQSIALIAVGGDSRQNPPAWELMSRCKSAGVNVIAYEDGANDWP